MLRPLSNPPNPWQSCRVEWIEGPPPARLQVYEERARSVLTENDSPDVGFRWSVNPYRGCLHACAYCYARPYHQYLDWGAGTDFERKIVVKVNAPELLTRHLRKPSWRGESIAFSGITDCYQPLEASYEITRRCLEVCERHSNPVGIITKGNLIRRDAELLGRMAAQGLVGGVFVSIPFADPAVARKMEPAVSPPAQRFETLRILSEAGVPTGIALAPIVPGLNESDIPELLRRAQEAGATRAFRIPLRLAAEVLPVFEERIGQALPEERVRKVLGAIRSVRGGKLNDSRFGHRQSGTGPRWEAVEALFEAHCRRLGLNQEGTAAFVRTTPKRQRARQGELFGLGEG